MKNLRIRIWIGAVCGICACANPGVPSGGEKDEQAPKITQTNPPNYTKHFDKKRVVIDFDEFVRLKDAFKNVVISPPQKKKPKIRLKEKQIVIELRDSLRANTTYTIDFGEAIVDNNEGNPLGTYRYVFATGAQIDKMGLAGYVKGAYIDTVAQEATVALYTPSDTLNPYQLLPEYIARTDSLGFFMFNNIVDGHYEIIAFQDENSNNMLDPDEPLAFKNDNVHTSVTEMGKEDSIQLDKYTQFKNTNLQLRIFKPTPSQQYLKDYKRPLPEQFLFVFNAPVQDSVTIELLNTKENTTFFIEESQKKDSLTYWIANTNTAQQDTLLAKLSYLRTDSLGDLASYDDTLKLTYKKPKKKRKEKKEKIDYMEIHTNMSGRLHYFDSLTLVFDRPVQTLKSEDITLFTLQDSTEHPQQFSLREDSLSAHRKYHVLFPLKPAEKYHLRIDSMRIYDSSNRPNKTVVTSFETYDEAHYGKIFVTLSGGEEGVLLQLINKQQENIVVAEKKWERDGKITFEKLPPATYLLKVLWDTNANGKWDFGDYKKHLQPERVRFFAKEIKLPSNWELEVSWTLKKEDNEE